MKGFDRNFLSLVSTFDESTFFKTLFSETWPELGQFFRFDGNFTFQISSSKKFYNIEAIIQALKQRTLRWFVNS